MQNSSAIDLAKNKKRPNAVARFFLLIGHMFLSGSIATKLSFIIMGFSNFAHKQIAKGLALLAIEIGFIIMMISKGAKTLSGLITLGTVKQGWAFDKSKGIPVMQNGDNSMLMLIYGLVVIILIILFFVVYLINIHSAYHLQELDEKGKSIPTLKEDFNELLDTKFHITLMIIPVLGILIFTIVPLIYMILIAFTNFDSTHQPPGNLFTWVGFQNFKDMLFSDTKLAGTFFPVLNWTLIWAVVATASNYIFGIILALMINNKQIRFKKMWRTIFVLTIAIPQFVSLLVMKTILDDMGALNSLLIQFGWIKTFVPFLSDPVMAKISVLVVNLWIGIPYTMLITTGILMNISADQYESARIDGANAFQIFLKITMPQILFITTPYLITQFIGNLNNFNVIYLLTQGNPTNTDFYNAGHTDLLVTWLYKLTADFHNYSVASTIGIVSFVICATFSLLTYTRSAAYQKEDNFQ